MATRLYARFRCIVPLQSNGYGEGPEAWRPCTGAPWCGVTGDDSLSFKKQPAPTRSPFTMRRK